MWVWKVSRHQPLQAISSPRRKASGREVCSSKWAGHKKLTMPFYIWRRTTVWWSLHSTAIGKGRLMTEARVGQSRGGRSFSLFASSPQWNCEQKLEESGWSSQVRYNGSTEKSSQCGPRCQWKGYRLVAGCFGGLGPLTDVFCGERLFHQSGI